MKALFSASLLQSSESHDPSEIILICWLCLRNISDLISVENSCAASYFLEPLILFSGFKRTAFIQNRNLLQKYKSVLFYQFNLSLLNKSIHFFPKKSILIPNFWTSVYIHNLGRMWVSDFKMTNNIFVFFIWLCNNVIWALLWQRFQPWIQTFIIHPKIR